MNEPYLFDDRDHEVVKLGVHLLAIIWSSDLVPEDHKPVLASMGALLKGMPANVYDHFNASVRLTGPRRRFGDHEICHFWTIESQGGRVAIQASGQIFRPSTDDDSFTSFTWLACPGETTECHDHFDSIRTVEDAQPFGTEVVSINLSEPGFEVTLAVNNEPIRREEDQDVERPNEENPSDEIQLAACLWAFVDADSGLIYSLGGRAYSLAGTEDEIMATLRQLSRHDFRSVQRSKVPERFCITNADGKEQVGLAYPDKLNDPRAMLFDEVFMELEEQLPPLPDFANGRPVAQSFGEAPLSGRTLVYEDAAGNCRAIVDDDDMRWLQTRL